MPYDEWGVWTDPEPEYVKPSLAVRKVQPVAPPKLQTKHAQTKHQTKHEGKSAGHRFSPENRQLGGAVRAQRLTPTERREIALRAAKVRWNRKKTGE